MEKNSNSRPSRKYVQDSVMGYCTRRKKLHVNLWKLPLAVGPLNYLTLHIISTFSNNSWKQNSTVSVSSFYTHRPNVFTLILFSSGGRAGITWVPSNKMIFLSPLRHKAPFASHQMFSIYFYFSHILPDSLSLSLRLKLVKLIEHKNVHICTNNFLCVILEEFPFILQNLLIESRSM
jgi:hypothetical protein